MVQTGQVVGTVEFRLGDGPKMAVPKGPFEVETTPADATLSWSDGKTHGAATLPLQQFKRYIAEGAIVIQT